MKCSYCGAPVEKGRVFCLNCGEEIQWVPEYHPIGSYRMNREDQERPSEEKTHQQIHPRRQETEKKPEKPKKKKTPLRAGIIILIIGVLCLLGFKWYMDQKNYNSYDYQFNMAETSYSNREYEKALEFVERAITLNAESEEALILKAQILYRQKEVEGAIRILTEVINANPGNGTAYGQLISIYENEKDMDSLKALITSISDEGMKEKYKSYLPVEVKASQPPGEYDECITVELYTEGDQKCSIYYTTDGTDPMLMRNLYKTGIELSEGLTTIRAVAVNEKDIVGDVKSYTYEVVIPPPDVPEISPASGEYTSSAGTQITVSVPEGCTAYYSFDEKPTKDSSVYTGPVDMPKGEHTFYAILIDENGKESYPGSATYVLKEEEAIADTSVEETVTEEESA